MAIPDNRLRLPAGPIDFVVDVGTTGQDHDNYPYPDTQPRYDWMRMYLISLLSQQSSYSEPTQYRDGTPWFDLNEMALKIRKNGDWVPFAEAVLIDTGITLASFYEEVKALNVGPEYRFWGTATAGSTSITIPLGTVARIDDIPNLIADVYINGILVFPDNISVSPSKIDLLNGISIASGDKYVVFLRNFLNPGT